MIEGGETAIVVAIVDGPHGGATEAEVGVAVETDGVTEGLRGLGPARVPSHAIDARAHAHRVAVTVAVTDTGEIQDATGMIGTGSDLDGAEEGAGEATDVVVRATITLITSRTRAVVDASARKTMVPARRLDSRKTTKMQLTVKTIASKMAVIRQLTLTRT